MVNNVASEWSDIYSTEPKALPKMDSVIMTDSTLYVSKFVEWLNVDEFELLYRGTRDGMSLKAFHKRCDNQGPTLTLARNDKGHIFGGYFSVPWTSPAKGSYRQSPNSFLFTLTNMYNIPPTKFDLKDKNDGYATYHCKSCGPVFGSGYDIYIGLSADKQLSGSRFPTAYNDTTGKGCSIFTSDLGMDTFAVNEIEVYKVIMPIRRTSLFSFV